MQTSDFDYILPKELIAQKPASLRDHCKLLVYVSAEDKIYHKNFFEIKDFVNKGDALVLNRSKVIPARINFMFGGKLCEIFLLKKLEENRYSALVKPGKFFSDGAQFEISPNLSAMVVEVQDDGTRVFDFFSFDASVNVDMALEKIGRAPFPPYIKNPDATLADYQTVFAREKGSVAAPTAGLHFTENLLNEVAQKGTSVVEVLLHVGLGTFLPVKSEKIEEHRMHAESFEMSAENAGILNETRKSGGRIFAVGTTSVRVLESSFANGKFGATFSDTDIFIYPGYKWKCVDALVTNFHLPKSTLLMLVSSFLENKGVKEPVKKLLEIYKIAMKNNYLFYSFGDAMLIL